MLKISDFLPALLFILFFNCLAADEYLTPLVLTIPTYRITPHRSPSRHMPNILPSSLMHQVWPDGFDQLTNQGKLEMYELGKELKEHYPELTGSNYSPWRVTANSYDFPGHLVASQCLMAGMYQATGEQVWNPDIPQLLPIPVHTWPDYWLNERTTEKVCAQYDSVMNGTMYANENFMRLLSEVSGTITKIIGRSCALEDVLIFREYMELISAQNLPRHPLITEELYRRVLQVTSQYYKMQLSTPTIARLKIGVVMGDIYKMLIERARGETTQSIITYTSTEAEQVWILEALGIENSGVMPNSAMLLIEMRLLEEQVEGQSPYGVCVRMKAGSGSAPQRLTIPKCGKLCPLEQFIEMIQEYAMVEEQWTEECRGGADGVGVQGGSPLYQANGIPGWKVINNIVARAPRIN